MKKNNTKNRIELLAPAGNLEKLETALLYGADAVYAGVPDFSLRVRINDFDLKKLAQAKKVCEESGKKIYVTINIFGHNKHLKTLPKYIRYLKKIKVDALIISDPGIISLVKSLWSEAEIHLSTQANCTNWLAAKFWYENGVSRVILGRETSLDEIKEIKKNVPKLELEYFVHGAMCMSYSGRCFLSSMFVAKSANLGDCVQPCRWSYFISEEKRPNQPLELVEEQHGSYILNSKDLCLIKYLDDLKKAGVDSFKIEGRAKSVYYQSVVVGSYRRAIDSLFFKNKLEYKKISKVLYKELETKLTHRGYTEGFLFGLKAEENTEGAHQMSAWEFCGQVLESKKLKTKKQKFSISVKVHNQIRAGDSLEILTPNYDIIKLKLKKIFNNNKKMFVESAHGGQGTTISFEANKDILVGSVVRRKINN